EDAHGGHRGTGNARGRGAGIISNHAMGSWSQFCSQKRLPEIAKGLRDCGTHTKAGVLWGSWSAMPGSVAGGRVWRFSWSGWRLAALLSIIKGGKTKAGQQRYKCQNTACPHSSFQRDLLYKRRAPAVKKKIVDMSLNGNGIGDTTRVLKISPTTVINALKKTTFHRVMWWRMPPLSESLPR